MRWRLPRARTAGNSRPRPGGRAGRRSTKSRAFLNPTIRSLMPQPSALKDMEKGAERLAERHHARKPIGIISDYDVDGVSSAALCHALPARRRLRCDHPHSRPPDRRLWSERRRGPSAAGTRRHACCSPSIAVSSPMIPWPMPPSSAWKSSSSIIIRPVKFFPRPLPSSIPTARMMFRASAISVPAAS